MGTRRYPAELVVSLVYRRQSYLQGSQEVCSAESINECDTVASQCRKVVENNTSSFFDMEQVLRVADEDRRVIKLHPDAHNNRVRSNAGQSHGSA